MLPKKLEQFYNQIDAVKLRAAIEFVSGMGNGTKAFYVQEIRRPYTVDVYISVSLRRDCWDFEAQRYGAFDFPEMRQALCSAADYILDEISAQRYKAEKNGYI